MALRPRTSTECEYVFRQITPSAHCDLSRLSCATPRHWHCKSAMSHAETVEPQDRMSHPSPAPTLRATHVHASAAPLRTHHVRPTCTPHARRMATRAPSPHACVPKHNRAPRDPSVVIRNAAHAEAHAPAESRALTEAPSTSRMYPTRVTHGDPHALASRLRTQTRPSAPKPTGCPPYHSPRPHRVALPERTRPPPPTALLNASAAPTRRSPRAPNM